MTTAPLSIYIDGKNLWASHFGDKEITYPPAPEDLAGLRDSLECDLSPENLTCDGEVRGAVLRQKAKYLKDCLKEVNTLERKYG
jgi:hypothetical protein